MKRRSRLLLPLVFITGLVPAMLRAGNPEGPTISDLDGDSVAAAGTGDMVNLDAGTDATASDEVYSALDDGNGNWSGATLTVSRVLAGGVADGNANDVIKLSSSTLFSIDTGADPFEGYPVAQITQGQDSTGALFRPDGDANGANWFARYFYTSATGTLRIRFGPVAGDGDINAVTSNQLINDLLQHISYQNDTPYGNALLRVSLSNGAETATADITVTSSNIYVDRSDDDATGDAADGFSLREALARGVAQGGVDTIFLNRLTSNTTVTLQGSTATLGAGDRLTYNAAGNGNMLSIAGNLGGGLALAAGTETMGDDTGETLIISAPISGPGNLTKIGNGIVTLSSTGNSTGWSGNLSATGGILRIDSSSNLPTGTLGLASATLAVTVAGSAGTIMTITNGVTLGAGGGAFDIGGGGGANIADFSGKITGSGSLTKTANSFLQLSHVANDYTGTTTVTAGKLRVTGALLGTSGVTVAGSGQLTGSGTIFPAASANTVAVNGILSPGSGGPGSLTINGNLTLNSGSTLALDLAGSTAGTGYDQVVVKGAVTLVSPTLSVTHSYSASPTDVYAAIVNDGPSPIVGTFSSLAESNYLTAAGNGRELRASYLGGDSNDFTLTPNVMPTNIGLTLSSVSEGLPILTTVGMLSATDSDPGDAATFTLVSGPSSSGNSYFSIDGSELKTAAIFDYEDRTSYLIRIRVTDSGGLYSERTFNISVSDVDEAPGFTGYALAIEKDTPATLSLAKLLARAADPEGATCSVTSVMPLSLGGGTVVLQAKSILYTPPAGVTGPDTILFTISDGTNPLSAVVNVIIGTEAGNGGTLLSIQAVDSDVELKFAGIPGTHYLVQRATTLVVPVEWTTLTTVTANASGVANHTDSSPPSPSYWRLIEAP